MEKNIEQYQDNDGDRSGFDKLKKEYEKYVLELSGYKQDVNLH